MTGGMRVGIGYDAHRFNGRGPLRLGGMTVPHAKGLSGHSDADVLLHAVADALFGALGAPDIGEQFPSSDPAYRHADSALFVSKAADLVKRRGWAITNVDTTVIADSPKLAGHKAGMSKAIGRLLGIPASCVSVKAKTTEAFCPGKGGIAVQAIVLLTHPSERKRR
jgi:2-C-methyl-D-erythritol 2,4-cyclodiphosphate synthase